MVATMLTALRHAIGVDRFAAGGHVRAAVSGSSFPTPEAKRRLQSTVLTAFAAVAALLAALGIYGVTAHSVTRRRREIGTRLALGARPRDVVLMIAKTGSRAIVIGALAGLAGAVALAKVLTSFMFGVSALDSATFAGVALLLTLVAGLALYLPSRRAAMVDPVIVLREA